MRRLPRSAPAAGRKGTSLSVAYALGHPGMGLTLVFVVYRGNLRVARLGVERQHVLLRVQLYELGAGITRGSIASLDNLARQPRRRIEDSTATRPIM